MLWSLCLVALRDTSIMLIKFNLNLLPSWQKPNNKTKDFLDKNFEEVLMAIDQSIITTFFNTIDQVAKENVSNSYHNLVTYLKVWMWSIVTIYVGFQFIQAMQGRRDFYDLLNTTFKIVAIMTLVTNYDLFCLYIYDIFTYEPLIISAKIAGFKGHSIGEIINTQLNSGLDFSKQLFMQGTWYNIPSLVFAGIFFIVTLLNAAISAGMILLAKCATILLLSLSPLFIFFALSDFTRGMFEAYIRTLITYALIPILTSALIMLLHSISTIAVTNIHMPDPTMVQCAPYLLFCIIQIYLLAHVYSKAAALGGGFTIAGFVNTMRQARSSVGAFLPGKNALNQAKNMHDRLFNYRHYRQKGNSNERNRK